MAQHQGKEDGLDEVELLKKLPGGVDHAHLKDLHLGDLVVFDDLLHAVAHVLDGVLVDRLPQVHRAHVEAGRLHKGGVAGLAALLDGQVGHAAGGDLDDDVALRPDVVHRLLQQAEIGGQTAAQVPDVEMDHGGAVLPALDHIPGDGAGIDEGVRGRHRGHGDHDLFHPGTSFAAGSWPGLMSFSQ